MAKEASREIRAALDDARERIVVIREALVGIELPGDHRHRVPAQLFDLAIEHASGIQSLIAANICASAFALVRCQFECFVRGAWLHHCANDAEIEAFVTKERVDPTFRGLIDAVEGVPSIAGLGLSAVRDDAMKAMHGYNHGGIHQVCRRIQGDYIEPAFEDEAMLEVINFSTAMAVHAFEQIVSLAGGDHPEPAAGA